MGFSREFLPPPKRGKGESQSGGNCLNLTTRHGGRVRENPAVSTQGHLGAKMVSLDQRPRPHQPQCCLPHGLPPEPRHIRLTLPQVLGVPLPAPGTSPVTSTELLPQVTKVSPKRPLPRRPALTISLTKHPSPTNPSTWFSLPHRNQYILTSHIYLCTTCLPTG